MLFRSVGPALRDDKRQRLAWSQKPASYAAESEYRLHIHIPSLEAMPLDGGYFKVRIGDISDYCEIIERKTQVDTKY